MNLNIIIKPIISEKSMSQVGLGKFTFEVAKSAGKNEIKKEVEKNFKVNVVSVATIVVKGRKKRTGTRRTEVAESSFKKAIVRLKPGQKIDLFEAGGKS